MFQARVPAPHVLLACFCVGLGLALAFKVAEPAIGLLGALVALVSLPANRHRVIALGLALFLVGWWWGGFRLDSLDQSRLRDQVGRTALARVEVTGPARQGAFSTRVPVRVRSFDRAVLSERALLKLPPERAPPQGAVLELVARITNPRGPSAGGFDEAAWLRRQGAHTVLRATDFRLVGRRGGLGGVADRLHHRIAETMAPGVAGERRAVIAGVVLGEDEGLDSELADRFRSSGLYHLLAVSGQNIAYVVGGVLLLGWLFGVPRGGAEAFALIAIGGYVMAVGWQPSVVRAGIAGGLASLAWLLARPRDRWYFLLVGAAVLLAWNPYSLLEPGFQLSFAAVGAIFVLVPRLERLLDGYPVPTRVGTIITVSGACGLATAPILWLHFGAVPIYSILSNALAAPVVAPLLGFALITAALEPVLPEAALALAWINGWLAAYLAGCARLVGGLPHAQISSGALLLGFSVLLLSGIVVRRLPRRRRREGIAVMVAALVGIGGWVWWPSRDVGANPLTSEFRVTFLDVGQGDAALLEVRDGAVLVDQGPPEAGVSALLRRRGIAELAAIVLTHPQRDHTGGAADVLREIEVGAVLEPATPGPSDENEEALAEAERRDVPILTARAGDVYEIGGMRLRVLWPRQSVSAEGDPNDAAVVMLASFGSTDVLLTADAESHVTLPIRPPPVEILKIAHHGSADEGLGQLLDLLEPRIAVVSSGPNRYGHPAASTLATLEAEGSIAVYRTDEDGDVAIESDGERIWVHTER